MIPLENSLVRRGLAHTADQFLPTALHLAFRLIPIRLHQTGRLALGHLRVVFNQPLALGMLFQFAGNRIGQRRKETRVPF